MVRTISNAFETGRIPQAWILTGVRGVGKTTTARILARALNYELPDGSVTGPTIDMPVLGVHCQAIMESRHIDVHRDGRRLAQRRRRRAPDQRRDPLCAGAARATRSTSSTKCTCCRRRRSTRCSRRWKSRRRTPSSSSPPPRSARCRSRCCRAASASICAASMPSVLVAHLAGIAGKESVEAEPEALALIARAAEGSVRDSLSLLDQAIAHARRPGARRGRAADARARRSRAASSTCSRR